MYKHNPAQGNGPRKNGPDGSSNDGFRSQVERNFFDILTKKAIRFEYEPKSFFLSGKMKYTPDFLLDIRKNNKLIILEPHGIWASEEIRHFFLGNKRGTLIAPSQHLDENEIRVVKKYSEFRRQYGKQFHLILFVPWRKYAYVRTQYSEAFDEIYAFEQLPEVLEKLSNKRRL